MLNLAEIEKFYPDSLKPFGRFLLREYLQYKILEIIFTSEYADKVKWSDFTDLDWSNQVFFPLVINHTLLNTGITTGIVTYWKKRII